MNFGQAIEHAINSKFITRKGWNGKNMYIFYTPETFSTAAGMTIDGKFIKYEPYLSLYTTRDTIQKGWVPSQEDILAKDWELAQ